jgi:ABC-type multidrug transport system fused ATPase/permease subunit
LLHDTIWTNIPLQTILSQDVSLFSGTIQSNLDPLGHCTPEECLVVLERCHLTTILNHTPTADEPTILDMRVNHGSLSAGEKQLLAVARATLRRTNIIILDEATSQVDSHLDDQVCIHTPVKFYETTLMDGMDRSKRRFEKNYLMRLL